MNKANSRIFWKRIMILAVAVILSIAAIFALWWYGAFLPKWVDWKESTVSYYDDELVLKNKSLSVISEGKCIWKSKNDWFIQNMIVSDLDRDGQDEITLLVWKHGSFGEHTPMWVKRNDIRLEQHIFIYKRDLSAEGHIKALWMSSVLGYNVESIVSHYNSKILVNDRGNNHKVWMWKDFGLKYAGKATEQKISFRAAGDNLIHQWMYRYGSDTNDSDYINGSYDKYYAHIKDYIEQADISSINQETPLVDDNSLLGDYPKFGTPSSVASALENAGFDVVSCSTNHALDRGMYGIDTTYKYLTQNNLKAVGINPSERNEDYRDGITFINKNHIVVAMLSYSYGTNGIKEPEGHPYASELFDNNERFIKQLRYARQKSDVVIVFAHWGTEYSEEIDDNQRELTSLMYDEGVDIVIGTHPHVLQDLDVVNEGDNTMYVFNSLGNFVSGQDKPERLIGGIACFDIVKAEDGSTSVMNPYIEKTVMHQDKDECTVYLLKDYSDEIAGRHRVEGMKEYIDTIKNP